MEPKKDRFLRLPRGTESIFLEEAYRHRHIVREIEKTFHQWGYLPVQTPVFDFYEVFRPLISHDDEEKIYRLVDREGDILMLRSDVTLFLAKQISRMISADDLPVRLSYADSILRHQKAEDIQVNEFFQVGAELIGKADMESDCEVLCLLSEILQEIGAAEYYLHLGNKKFFNTIFNKNDFDSIHPAERAVQNRDEEGISELLNSIPEMTKKKRNFLTKAFLFIGNPDDFQNLLKEGKGYLEPYERNELEYLSSIQREYVKTGLPQNIRIDLSEIGTQSYHTGIAFQVYKTGIDSAIASGGRYDNLLRSFGFAAPSIGFSIMLRKIEKHLPHPTLYYPPGKVENAEGSSFSERYLNAKKRKRNGRIVIL